MNLDILQIYLNDHLAGSVGGIELARRCRDSNAGSALGTFLDTLVEHLEEDQTALRGVIEKLRLRESAIKMAGGWVAEKLGRLKTNGQLTGYSPLSRVIELEGLMAGSQARAELWQSLRHGVGTAEELDGVEFEFYEGRAHEHIEELQRHHRDASIAAFA